MMTGLPRGRMSALRDLGFYQVLEPVEVGGDEPLRPAAQQAGGQRNGPRGVARIEWVRSVAAPSAVRRYSSWKRTGPAMPTSARRPGGS